MGKVGTAAFLFVAGFTPIMQMATPLKKLINQGKAPKVESGYLDLSRRNLSNIRAIEQYPDIEKVEFLSLADNKIRDIGPLEKLKNLRGVELTSNCVDRVDPLCGLPHLEVVLIEGNAVTDENLKKLCAIASLKRLVVDDNPVKASLYRYLMREQRGANYLDHFLEKGGIRFVEQPRDGDSCAICLNTRQGSMWATPCNHLFHGRCLQLLFHSKAEQKQVPCPNCRRPLDAT